MTGAIVSFTTINTDKDAKKLARQLVEKKLAACVNVIPKIRSFYEWDGEIHDETEYLLMIKTTSDNLASVKGFIDENHSYEVPEFIALDIVDGLPAYLQWLTDMTS